MYRIALLTILIFSQLCFAGDARKRYSNFPGGTSLTLDDIVVWLKMNDNTTDPLLVNTRGVPRLTEDSGNPTRDGSDQAWEDNNISEHSDFKVSDTSFISWYRAGKGSPPGVMKSVGYSTSIDGITYTPDANNPLSFAPTITDGNTLFPNVLKDGNSYYLFVKDKTSDGDIYLFDVTDPTSPSAMYGGVPVLTAESGAWDDTIYNVGVEVVDGTWHMLYEGNDSGLAGFNLGYSHATLADPNFNNNKSSTRIIY